MTPSCVTVELSTCRPQHLPYKKTGTPVHSPCMLLRGLQVEGRKVAGSVQQAADLTCAQPFTRWHFMLLPSNWLLSSPGLASWSWAWTAIIARPAPGSQDSSCRLGQTSVSIPSLNKESPPTLSPHTCVAGETSAGHLGEGAGNTGRGKCPPMGHDGQGCGPQLP